MFEILTRNDGTDRRRAVLSDEGVWIIALHRNDGLPLSENNLKVLGHKERGGNKWVPVWVPGVPSGIPSARTKGHPRDIFVFETKEYAKAAQDILYSLRIYPDEPEVVTGNVSWWEKILYFNVGGQ